MTARTTPDRFQKPRILVVDDEKRIRDGCLKVLVQAGYDVAEAESGTISLEMIEREHFDVILLDLMMPSLSGFDVLSHVKAAHPDTTIIVISGYATVDHSIEAMKKGAFDFIPKPFSPEQLRVVVAKAVEYTRALEDIAHEKSRMRAIINHLGDGVMVNDVLKSVVLANPAFLRMVGYRDTDKIGRQVAEVTRSPQLERMIDEVLTMPEDTFVELCEELSMGEGKDPAIILKARCVPFRDRFGRNLGTVTVLQDITAVKKMDQLKSDFVSMVAHEIRSPLNSVLMQLHVIMDGLAGELTPKQHEFLNRVSERLKGLTDLSSELLDLAKIESGLLAQERQHLDVNALLDDQVAFHLPKAQARNITISRRPAAAPLPAVLANHQNMEEVLSNLITNAIHYTPEGGSVTLDAAVEGDCVRISVADTGIGIPEEEQEKIFDRFYRVKDERTKYVVGTGLGLAIVKSVVESHDGRISVASKPGQGTTFSVYLSLASA